MSSAKLNDAFDRIHQASSSRAWQPLNSRNAKKPKETRQILVAVDFGTTYSAAAWAYTSTDASSTVPLNPRIIDTWPEEANTQHKVPTILQRQPSANDNNFTWGFDYDERRDRFQWFKLEQDPKYKGNVLSPVYPPMTEQPQNEAQVEDLISSYLSLLRQHVVNSIKDSMDVGGGRQEAILRDSHWQYIITVPAMWPESAQNITERCAKAAGMTPLRTVSEPEAAGTYALDKMNQDPGLQLEVNDTFVICDAGGGTVDLISYTITKLQPTIGLREAAAGRGGLCGSTFLDRAFSAWLDRYMSGCAEWNQNSYEDAMEKWEKDTKRNFKGDTNRTYSLPARGIPDDCRLNIRRGYLEVPGEEVKRIFDCVIPEILNLVRGQIHKVRQDNKIVKAVLLAGGFGRNEYLKRSIERTVGDSVKVKMIENCETAIVRGALLPGLGNRRSATQGRPTIVVESRLARKHYGTKALQKYVLEHHDSEQPRLAGGVDGGERINVMQWFINKVRNEEFYQPIQDYMLRTNAKNKPQDTRIKDLEPKYFKFYYDQLVTDVEYNGRLDTINLPIFTCENDKPPEYPDAEGSGNGVCKRLVEVKADLDKIPKKQLRKEKGTDNEWYYKIDFEIVMLCHLANIIFKLVHNGKTYGEVDAVWDIN